MEGSFESWETILKLLYQSCRFQAEARTWFLAHHLAACISCTCFDTKLQLHSPPAALSGDPVDLTPACAFAIMPIAHIYDMQAVLKQCQRLVLQQKRPAVFGPLGPEQPGSSQAPGLFDWLFLADDKQCTPLVQACYEHLRRLDTDSYGIVRAALANPVTRAQFKGLRSDTLLELLHLTTSLPTAATYHVSACSTWQ